MLTSAWHLHLGAPSKYHVYRGDFKWVGALGYGGLNQFFASSLAPHSGRSLTTDLARWALTQADRAWGRWSTDVKGSLWSTLSSPKLPLPLRKPVLASSRLKLKCSVFVFVIVWKRVDLWFSVDRLLVNGFGGVRGGALLVILTTSWGHRGGGVWGTRRLCVTTNLFTCKGIEVRWFTANIPQS